MGSFASKVNRDDTPPPRPIDKDKDFEKDKRRTHSDPGPGPTPFPPAPTPVPVPYCPTPERYPSVGMRSSVARSSEGAPARGTNYSLPRHSAFNTSSEYEPYSPSGCQGSESNNFDFLRGQAEGKKPSAKSSSHYSGSEYAFLNENPGYLGFTPRVMADSTASSIYDASVRSKKSSAHGSTRVKANAPPSGLLSGNQREFLHEASSSSEAPAPPAPRAKMEPIFGRKTMFPDPNFRKAEGMKWRKPVHGLDYCSKPKKL